MFLKGITVTLLRRVQTGTDGFGCPVYGITEETVDNVLFAPANLNELPSALDLSGYKAVCTLALPKEDAHEWEGNAVRFLGHDWEVVGTPLEGITALIPGDWNKKVTVARYG